MAHSVAAVASFVIACSAVACSRDVPPTGGTSNQQQMRPAAGQTTPSARKARSCSDNFAAFDEDGDGLVSLEEFEARPHAHPNPAGVFQERDTNGDGTLTEGEFCSNWRQLQARNRAPAERADAGAEWSGPPGPGGRGRMQGPLMGMRCEQHFDAFDTDDNGKLTRNEFAAWPHPRGDAGERFILRDADQDGTITLDEFCAPAR